MLRFSNINRPHREIAKYIYRVRNEYFKRHPPKAKGNSWVETHEENGTTVTYITIILVTRGCTWALSNQGGCTFCGYVNDSAREYITTENIVQQLYHEWERYKSYNGTKIVKIYNSGSFFDNKEISEEGREKILTFISSQPGVKKIIVEARPENMIIGEKKLEHAASYLQNGVELEVGIGLESSNNRIRQDSCNKGFTFDHFKRAVQMAKKYGIKTKSYIMIKPPFLTEYEAIIDSIQSAYDSAAAGCNSISLNATNIHAGTIVDDLFIKKRYRPPWLWSVLTVLINSLKLINGKAQVICEPVAGGLTRGAHNCGRCDSKVIQAINYISVNQKIPDDIETLDCKCKRFWEESLLQEQMSYPTFPFDYKQTKEEEENLARLLP